MAGMTPFEPLSPALLGTAEAVEPAGSSGAREDPRVGPLAGPGDEVLVDDLLVDPLGDRHDDALADQSRGPGDDVLPDSLAGPRDDVLADPIAEALARALRANPVRSCMVDQGLRLRWGNDAFARSLGRSPDDLPGFPLTDLVHAVDRGQLRSLGEAAISAAREQADPPGHVRVRGATPGQWFDLTMSLVGSAAPGQPVHLLVQLIDASTSIHVTQALRILSENTLDIVILTEPQGRVTWASPSLRAVLGRDPESLVGSDLTSLTAPDDLIAMTDVLAGAAPGRTPAVRTVRFRSTTGAFRAMSVTARPTDDADAGTRIAIAMRDITEELRAKRELARSEEQFRMAMHGAPEGMAVTDSQDRIVQANPALCELLGTSVEKLIGHRFREYIPEEEREQVDQWRDRLLRGTASIERCQHRLTGPASEVWVDHSVGILREELGNPQLFVHQFADRTAARRLQADLAYRASHDVQTGLANRESLRIRLGQRLGHPPETAEFVGVLFCDIDNLKPINDRFGHLTGDAVISSVANRLERAVRRQDVVARMGGDEFVIMLDHCSSREELSVVARNVHAAASHPVETPAGTIDVTITVGAVLAESTADTDAALARADAALYRAKRAGRNRICVEGDPD